MEINVIIEPRIVMKFLIKSGKPNAEIKEMLRAVYGNATLNRPVMYEWIGWFRESWEDERDNPLSWCSSHEHRSFLVRSCSAIPSIWVDLAAFSPVLQGGYQTFTSDGFLRTRIFLRVPFRVPLARLKKKKKFKKENIIFGFLLSRPYVRREVFAPGWGTSRSVPVPRPVSASVSPACGFV